MQVEYLCIKRETDKHVQANKGSSLTLECEEHIEKGLRDMGLEGLDWIHLAQDRDQ
jgi:hypothetical protein